MKNISNNLNQIQQQIQAAAKSTGRKPTDITLLVVSKTREAKDLEEAYAAGQKHFGENYLQESLAKIDALSSYTDICWHFIGPIQSNKTRTIATHFDWVHSVDRIKVAQRLSEQRPAHLPPLNICLQINISKEDSKAGISPEQVASMTEEICRLTNIKLRGLMAIPKATNDSKQQIANFQQMNQLFTELKQQYPHLQLDTLSMGMSGDMTIAIAQGANIVRIGTAIFGPRS